MLNAFKQLTDLHKDGWQLHFVGSVGSDEGSTNMAKSVVQNSLESPVFFHFNATLKEVQDLYRRASIYWHATGFGFDVERHPGQQEHFGISTVEAMSAGAVPIVYGSGGQKEIVTDRMDGFWWHDLDELIAHTLNLTSNPSLRVEMSEKAILSSKKFGRQAFADKIDQLVASVCS
jgi:glycosyltransferase involved in cell wall biosynthesis